MDSFVGTVALRTICRSCHLANAHSVAKPFEQMTDKAATLISDDFFRHAVAGDELEEEGIGNFFVRLVGDGVRLDVAGELVHDDQEILFPGGLDAFEGQDVQRDALHRALCIAASLDLWSVGGTQAVHLAMMTGVGVCFDGFGHPAPPDILSEELEHLVFAGVA